MKKDNFIFWGLVLATFAVLGIGACTPASPTFVLMPPGDTNQNTNIGIGVNAPAPVFTPAPAPTPTPSPTPGQGT